MWGEHSLIVFKRIIEFIAIIAILFLIIFGYKNYKIQHSNASNRIKSQANYSQEFKNEENKADGYFNRGEQIVEQTISRFKTGINASN